MNKRIDFIISSLKGGGAERVCVTLANNMIKKGYDVRVVVLNLEGSVYKKDLNKKVKIINLHKKHVRESLFAIAKYLRYEKPPLFLVFNHRIAVLLVLLRVILRKNFIIISRNINTLSIEREFESSIWHKHISHELIKIYYKKVEHIIAQSKGMADDLIRNYGITPKKITIIYNPVANSIVQRSMEVKEKSSECYKNKAEILYVGRLVYSKGVHFLISAFQLCIKKHPNLTLRILGEGPLKNELITKINCLSIQDNVIFQGFQTEIFEYYYNASVTALSSHFEGFPNVLIESITVGTPVVAFDCPSGPSEIIIDGVNGFLVEYMNVEELAEKLCTTLEHNWDFRSIQETSNIYSPDVITKKYIDTIEEVAKRYS